MTDPDQANKESTSARNLAFWHKYKPGGPTGELNELISLTRAAAATTSEPAARAAALSNLAVALLSRTQHTGEIDDLNEAERSLRLAVAMVPPGTPEQAAALSNLGAALLRRYELAADPIVLMEASAVLRYSVFLVPDGTPEEIAALSNLGSALLHQAKQGEGLADLNEATVLLRRLANVAQGDSIEYATAVSSLGDALRLRAERLPRAATVSAPSGSETLLSEAAFLYEEGVAAKIRILGEGHPDTLASMNNLAGVLQEQGDLSAARDLHQRVTMATKRLLGEDHPNTLASQNNFALVLHDMGDLRGAQELHEQVLATRRRLLGDDHPAVLTSQNNLATVIQDQGDLAGAQRLYEEVLQARRRRLGYDHPDVLASMNNLASVLQDKGQLKAAERLYEEILAARRRVLGEEHPDTLTSMNNLLALHRRRGDTRSAAALRQRTFSAVASERTAEGSVLAQLLPTAGSRANQQQGGRPGHVDTAGDLVRPEELEGFLEGARQGDTAAWDVLIERYAPLVWGVVRGFDLRPADASDVSQAVWLRLIGALEGVRDPDMLTSWLTTMTRQECLRVLRNPTVPTEVKDSSSAGSSDEVAIQKERSTAVWAALGRLPERCQQLLRHLALTPDASYQEVAEAIGMSVGSIGPTRSRCLALLRKELAAEGVAPPLD